MKVCKPFTLVTKHIKNEKADLKSVRTQIPPWFASYFLRVLTSLSMVRAADGEINFFFLLFIRLLTLLFFSIQFERTSN